MDTTLVSFHLFLYTESSDDDGIARYEWEEVQGPLEDNLNKDEQGNFPNEKVRTFLFIYIFTIAVNFPNCFQ